MRKKEDVPIVATIGKEITALEKVLLSICEKLQKNNIDIENETNEVRNLYLGIRTDDE